MRTTAIISTSLDRHEFERGKAAGCYAAKHSLDGIMRPKDKFGGESAYFKEGFELNFFATWQKIIASGVSPYYNYGRQLGQALMSYYFKGKSLSIQDKELFDKKVEELLLAKGVKFSEENFLKFQEGFRKSCDIYFNNKLNGKMLGRKRKLSEMDEELLDLVDMDEDTNAHKRRKIESQPASAPPKPSQDQEQSEEVEVIAEGHISSFFDQLPTLASASGLFSQSLPVPGPQDAPEKQRDDVDTLTLLELRVGKG